MTLLGWEGFSQAAIGGVEELDRGGVSQEEEETAWRDISAALARGATQLGRLPHGPRSDMLRQWAITHPEQRRSQSAFKVVSWNKLATEAISGGSAPPLSRLLGVGAGLGWAELSWPELVSVASALEGCMPKVAML